MVGPRGTPRRYATSTFAPPLVLALRPASCSSQKKKWPHVSRIDSVPGTPSLKECAFAPLLFVFKQFS